MTDLKVGDSATIVDLVLMPEYNGVQVKIVEVVPPDETFADPLEHICRHKNPYPQVQYICVSPELLLTWGMFSRENLKPCAVEPPIKKTLMFETMRTQLVRGVGNIDGCSGARTPTGGYPNGDRKGWFTDVLSDCLWNACHQYYQSAEKVKEALVITDFPDSNNGELVLHLQKDGVDDTFKITIPYSQIDHWCLA